MLWPTLTDSVVSRKWFIDYEAAIFAYRDTGVPHDIEKDIPKAVDAALKECWLHEDV